MGSTSDENSCRVSVHQTDSDSRCWMNGPRSGISTRMRPKSHCDINISGDKNMDEEDDAVYVHGRVLKKHGQSLD